MRWAVFKGTLEVHKGVNTVELVHIQRGLPPARKDEPEMPWTKLLTHRNIWVICIGFFMINYGSYFFITRLPTYLVRERDMGLMQTGLIASLPLFTSMLVEVFTGWALDRVYTSSKLLLMATRRPFLITGLVTALSIGLATFVQSAVMAVVLPCVMKSGTTVVTS